MSTMTDVRSVGANAKVDNILTGKISEFVSIPSAVRVWAVASAVGMRATIIMGEAVLMDDQEISGANRFPLDPDDRLVEIGVLPGERMVVSLRNTTGAAITVNSKVSVDPV